MEKQFEKRSLICFLLIIFFFFTCILRLTVIASRNYAEVQSKQSSLRISAGAARGTIFDCNMRPITNAKKKYIACVSPTPRAITGISSILSGQELTLVLEMLKKGKPVLCEVDEKKECDGISYTTIYEHNSSETPSTHLIGYTNSDSHGVSGLEKAFDEILFSNKNVDFVFTKDGLGNILEGIEPTVENEGFAMNNGIITTLDLEIQEIVEIAAKNLQKGSILVCETKTGKIKAMASRPTFDCSNIVEYLSAPESPLLNRALCAYNVGSVFKPCVAAAGIEAGESSFLNNCVGSMKIGNRNFKCHNHNGHGILDLTSAIALSCNTYFYSFGKLIGADTISKFSSFLQFGRRIKLCDGIFADAGNIPSEDSLINSGNFANFSIGQGQLLLSPVALLNLYNAIGNKGKYTPASVVQATITDGIRNNLKEQSHTLVMEENTAETLKNALISVIEEGTASEAKPSKTTAAGKTSTAQTGKFNENGVEINQGWFCGFFPADEPKYTVIVFAEDLSIQEYSCAEIFTEIADRISE